MGMIRLAGIAADVFYNVTHTGTFQYPVEVLIHFHKTIRLKKLVFIIAQLAATILPAIDISKRGDKTGYDKFQNQNINKVGEVLFIII